MLHEEYGNESDLGADRELISERTREAWWARAEECALATTAIGNREQGREGPLEKSQSREAEEGGMRQLRLFPDRHEIPYAYWSWREGDQIVTVEIGAHCYDASWPHWRPWSPR